MDLLKDIIDKYTVLEAEADKKLEKVKREEEKLEKMLSTSSESSSTAHAPKTLSYEEAKTRNANLLKSLEMAKARLRSRSTFSPVEQILEKAIENYKRDLRLSTTSSTAEAAAAAAARMDQVQIQESHQSNDNENVENIYEVLEN